MNMDTTMNSLRNDQLEANLEAASRRVGIRVFVAGSLVQTVAVFLFGIALMTVAVYRRTMYGPEIWSWETWKLEMIDQIPFWVSIGIGGLASTVVSIPFGSWAGKMIGIRKRSFAWVGPLAAFLPAMVAGFVLVVTILIFRPTMYEVGEDSFLLEFLLPSLVFSLLFFLPGILTSMMGGLAIRQKMRSKEEEFRMENESNHLKETATTDGFV
jgi:hypothetical protein